MPSRIAYLLVLFDVSAIDEEVPAYFTAVFST
jgi:hypothetical protein